MTVEKQDFDRVGCILRAVTHLSNLDASYQKDTSLLNHEPGFTLPFLSTFFCWYVFPIGMKHEGTNDALTTHYLAGRSFGPVVMSGTLFASLFSGYTVVGVPNEAFYTGWFSLRRMAGRN